MKTLKTITILTLLITSLNLTGQINTEIETKDSYIEVIGMAEKEIAPDEIYISITIRERIENKEKITIEKQEFDLKEALKSLEISLDNFSLSDANANYIRIKWTKKDVIAKSEYLLKVENAMTIGKVFQKLNKLKIVDAHISRVSHSKILEFKKEVRIMAIKEAKEKADYLLQAIGEQIGKAIKVNEISPNSIENDSYLNVRSNEFKRYYNSNDMVDKLNDSTIVQFQKIKLKTSIYVKFQIK
ncbi:MAG: hypothetical protein COB15_16000 [Flavobacteriales bacterium]|nr:MAG: hypothetical protein COB15_16000 [Flavobacteriales bacterium]